MRKILTTLGCALALSAFSLPASADVTITAVNPTPGIAIPSSGYGLWISTFTINLSGDDINSLSANTATAILKYQEPNADSPQTKTGTVTKTNNDLFIAFGGDEATGTFLEAGAAAGATEWEVTVTGISYDGNLTSNVPNCTVETSLGNIITLTYPYAEGGDSGSDTTSWQIATWENSFNASSSSPKWQLPSLSSIDYYDSTDFYLVTDSQTDLVYEGNFLYTDESMNPNFVIQPTPVSTENGYVYTGSFSTSYQYLYVVYNGATPINFTAYPGTYVDENRETITEKEPFTVEPQTKYWYTAPEGENDFYLVSNSPNNVQGLLIWKNENGYLQIEFTGIEGADGNYIYIPDEKIGGQSYYFMYDGMETDLQFTLYLGKYDDEIPTPTANIIEELGVDYTANSAASVWTYTDADEMASFDAYLLTDCSDNLVAEGKLTLSADSYVYGEYDWEAVLVDNVYAYNFTINGGIEYKFTFDVDTDVVFSINEGVAGEVPELGYSMLLTDTIELDDPMSSVELTWGVPVSIAAGSEVEVPVNLLVDGADSKFKGNLSLTYFQLIGSEASEPGIMKAVEFGDEGTTLVILTGASGLFDEVGTYQIILPEGFVQNEAGALNPEDYLMINVTAFAEGEVKPENGIFAEGEEVIITVTYDGTIEQVENEDPVIYVYGGPSEEPYEAFLTWESEELTVVGDTLIINLGTELPLGSYELAIYGNSMLINGVENTMQYIYFQVTDDSEGVNSIGAALEGNETIYNLQGVKVNANKLSKGIYIINGKKVLVK